LGSAATMAKDACCSRSFMRTNVSPWLAATCCRDVSYRSMGVSWAMSRAKVCACHGQQGLLAAQPRLHEHVALAAG
jgi:hypothetical protein